MITERSVGKVAKTVSVAIVTLVSIPIVAVAVMPATGEIKIQYIHLLHYTGNLLG